VDTLKISSHNEKTYRKKKKKITLQLMKKGRQEEIYLRKRKYNKQVKKKITLQIMKCNFLGMIN